MLSTSGNQDTNKIVGETENHEQKLHNEKKEDTKNKDKMVFEVERKTGVSFPVKLSDEKELKAVGIRKKNVLGLSLKIYSFGTCTLSKSLLLIMVLGIHLLVVQYNQTMHPSTNLAFTTSKLSFAGIYADNQKLMSAVNSKVVTTPPEMASKTMYEKVIDNPVGITVKMVIVFPRVPMSMVRNNFNEGIGVAIKKLGSGNSNDLTKRIMGEAKDNIKLTSGSEIEVTCLPGNVLETKVCGKVVNKIESELLCRACVYLYLGDDPLDKDAKDKFGMSLLSLI